MDIVTLKYFACGKHCVYHIRVNQRKMEIM